MQFHVLCKVLQLFCRVRGYKHVIKFFPHEVWHIELCMSALRAQVIIIIIIICGSNQNSLVIG